MTSCQIVTLKRLICCGLGTMLTLIAVAPALAQPKPKPFKANPVAVANKPSQMGLTVPSLWWAAEQFGGKLLDRWSAYPANRNTPRRVDVIVRPEIWTDLSYIERYAFVNHFGSVTSDYGYNLQVFDRENNLLATYSCDLSQASPQLLANLRDAQGQLVPNYSPQNSGKLACQLRFNPLSQ